MKSKMKTLIAMMAASGFVLFGAVACDSPEQTEPPVTQEAAEQPMQQGQEQEAAAAEHHEGQAGEPAAQEGMAQQAPPQHAQMGQPQHAEEVTSEQLDEFAEAFKEVQAIQGEVQERLQAVQSQEEAQQVQQEIVAQIQERVESTGMEFQDYMMLAQRLEQDPALQQRLESRL